LLKRDGSPYAYQLTAKGVQVALLFRSFTSAYVVCWPTAAFTTNPILRTALTASWKPPITKPTVRFRIVDLLAAA
jgi:hypothetical protein